MAATMLATTARCPDCGSHYWIEVTPPLGAVGSDEPVRARVSLAPHACGQAQETWAEVVPLRPTE